MGIKETIQKLLAGQRNERDKDIKKNIKLPEEMEMESYAKDDYAKELKDKIQEIRKHRNILAVKPDSVIEESLKMKLESPNYSAEEKEVTKARYEADRIKKRNKDKAYKILGREESKLERELKKREKYFSSTQKRIEPLSKENISLRYITDRKLAKRLKSRNRLIALAKKHLTGTSARKFEKELRRKEMFAIAKERISKDYRNIQKSLPRRVSRIEGAFLPKVRTNPLKTSLQENTRGYALPESLFWAGKKDIASTRNIPSGLFFNNQKSRISHNLSRSAVNKSSILDPSDMI